LNAVKYLLSAAVLLLFAYWTFRRIVRHRYLQKGKLNLFASLLQLLVFVAYFGFPTLFNPPKWYLFWQYQGEPDVLLHFSGLVLICLGILVAFGTMGWFGLKKAFGIDTGGLTKDGPYRFSRNPQIIGGFLLVCGSFLQQPSWSMLGWATIYGIIAHWMVVTEEEHLSQIFGEEYTTYCTSVPRYILR
jgi:protein-S-isoprenylcysteine O-methyltransferase Ste14